MAYMCLYSCYGGFPYRYTINFAEFLLFAGRGVGYPYQVDEYGPFRYLVQIGPGIQGIPKNWFASRGSL